MIRTGRLAVAWVWAWACVASVAWAAGAAGIDLAALKRVGPVPDWVALESVPAPKTAAAGPERADDDSGDGIAYLLSEQHVDVPAATRFFRMAYVVTATHGLDDASRVDASFDPAYQTLTWHGVTVQRAGRVIYELDPAKIEMSRRYEELEWSIYDNSVTAFLLLEDLRVGDVVDIQYSITGFNPVFGARMAEVSYMQWDVPASRVVREYRMPPGRPLRTREWAGARPPEIETTAERTIHRWRTHDVPAAEYDWDAPPDWDPSARVQVSEFASWADVVEWALPLYPAVELPASVWESIPAGSRKPGEDPLVQANALLQFVQEEIRYLSVAVGEGTHRPSHPAETLSRRFGDCKDKAYLFCTLVRPLGLRAVPALVDTDICEGVRELLPAPTAFDHVIVRLDLPDGTRCWVDPTATRQGGSLTARAVPRCGVALPIERGVSELEPIAENPVTADSSDVEETFTVKSFDEPATLEVSTVYRGRAADRMRARVAGTARAELSRSFVQFYSNTYPEFDEGRPFEVEDRRLDNVLTLRESYRIRNLWLRQDGKGPYAATLFPQAVFDVIDRPEKTMRTSPCAVAHPVNVRQTTTLRLPEAWPDENKRDAVRNAFVSIETVSKGGPTGFSYTTTYESLARVVPAAAVANHARDLDRAIKGLGFELTWDPEAGKALFDTDNVSWLRIVASPLVFGVMVAGFLTWARHRGPPPLPGPGPEGIAGWLILVILHIVLRGIAAVAGFVQGASTYYNPTVWDTAMSTVEPAWQSAADLALWTEFLTIHALLANVAVLLPLFFMRHCAVKKLAICGYALMFACAIAGAVALHLFPHVELTERLGAIRDVVATAIGGGIWISYFAVSRRVANTFRR